MCGILGTIPQSDPRLFEKALTTLQHRGPDGSGIWHADTEGGSVGFREQAKTQNPKPEISLGHRRLSILDTSELGRQPMPYGERYVMVFNGEVYNFLEVRRDLVALGYRFQSESDTEVVIAAYAAWGADCLPRFNGMWAMAIWDKHDKRLFLARDRFGKKPLFYAFEKGQFIFASEMKAILPFLEKPEASAHFHWCRQNIYVYEATEKCLIEGIKRFPAGHYAYLDVATQSLKPVKYWHLLENLQTPPPQYSDQIEQFRELFVDACRIRMRADVPIGTSLSGGLDSSAVVGTMAEVGRRNFQGQRVQQDWQHAFVAVFPDTEIDERHYAQKMVEHIGIQATYVAVDAEKSLDKLDHYLYLFEELYSTTPIPMIETYKKVRENGVIVTLDGHGADELLSGYSYDLYEAFFDIGFDLAKIKEVIATRDAVWGKNTEGGISTAKAMKELAYFGTRVLGVNALHTLNKLPFIKDRFRLPVRRHQKQTGLDHFNSLLYDHIHYAVLPIMLRNYDRFAMAASVENRMPFLDYRVVSFLMSLPYTSKIRNGYIKAILRDALGRFMPPEVTYRKPKIGFTSPLNKWVTGAWKPFIMDTLSSKDFKESALVDVRKTTAQFHKIMSTPKPNILAANNAWQALTPFLWEKAMLKKQV
jgi:asparagine synthase (glutamine-hydrolysing)